MLGTKEHYDLIAQFERDLKIRNHIADKEEKRFWKDGHIYCHHPTSEKFIAYRFGYAYGKAARSGKENQAIAELFQAARAVCDNRTCDETRQLTIAMLRLEAALSALGTGDGT